MKSIWLEGAFSGFSRALSQNRLPGSVLISGTPGTGVYDLAFECVRLCLCHSPANGRACGQCRSCTLLDARGHPDFAAVLPSGGPSQAAPKSTREDDPEEAYRIDGSSLVNNFAAVREVLTEWLRGDARQGGGSMTVRKDTLGQLGDYLYSTPVIARRRVALITHAHLMQPAAANSMLKIFEEPPANTLIVMVARSQDRLLPTILSRAYKIAVHGADPDMALAFLRERGVSDGGRARFALSAALNEPYTALSLIRSEADKDMSAFVGALCDLVRQPGLAALNRAVTGVLAVDERYRMAFLNELFMQVMKYKARFPEEGLPLLGGQGAVLAGLSRERLLDAVSALCDIAREEGQSALALRADEAVYRQLVGDLAGRGAPA